MEDDVVVPLTPYDNIMPRIYAYTLYILQTRADKRIEDIHNHLEATLAQTVADLPFLSGKVFLTSEELTGAKGKLEIRLPGNEEAEETERVKFRDLRGDMDLEDLLDAGIPDDTLDGNILNPAPLFGDLEAGADVVVCQANFIEGGCILSVGIHHSVCDGAGQVTVMKLWTHYLQQTIEDRAGMLSPHALDPCVADKEILRRLWREADNIPDGSAYKQAPDELWRFLGVNDIMKPADSSLAEGTAAKNEDMVTSIFYVSGEAFASMKQEASRTEDGKPDALSKQITANDALMAFLWQATMRARFPPKELEQEDSTEAILDSTFDGRGIFSHKLPPVYVGNLVLMNTATMPLRELIDPSTTVAAPARRVREALNTITTKQVHAAFTLADSLPNYTTLTFPFATFAGCELCITSVINNPAFELNFGTAFANDGRPVSIRPPRSEFANICRRCIALPRRLSGGFEVLIAIFDSEMARLDQDPSFKRWAKFISH
jgi:hypothetical protein